VAVYRAFGCVGSESGGIWIVSMYTGMVLGYGEIGECIVLLHG
jgi:hypothetical protein